jgi:hypothetical protein
VTRILIVLICATLSACATTAGYEKILRSQVGSDEVALIRAWGSPVNSYETGGRKFLTYSSRRNVYIPGTAPTYKTSIIGNTAYTTSSGGTSASNISMSCETTFEIAGGKVVSWRYKGNDCTAIDKELTPPTLVVPGDDVDLCEKYKYC